MKTTTTPTVTLNNGVEMPILGFGVFQVPPEQTEAAVVAALEAAYRSLDTAAAYLNEEAVGRAINESGIARDELFVTITLSLRPAVVRPDPGRSHRLKPSTSSLAAA